MNDTQKIIFKGKKALSKQLEGLSF